SQRLASAEDEWRSDRRRIEEASAAAKRSSVSVSQRAAAMHKKREEMLSAVDSLVRDERTSASRIATIAELVERDRRRAIETTARRLRAAAASQAEPKPLPQSWSKEQQAEAMAEAKRLVD
ncbi:unnamed protein product, partial [Polarella glacialis]